MGGGGGSELSTSILFDSPVEREREIKDRDQKRIIYVHVRVHTYKCKRLSTCIRNVHVHTSTLTTITTGNEHIYSYPKDRYQT